MPEASILVRVQKPDRERTSAGKPRGRDGPSRAALGLEGTRATILGLAREGTALARYLARHGVDVTVSDMRSADELAPQIQSLAGLDVRYALGGHPPEILETDVVYVSPGIPPSAPPVVAARHRAVRLSSATELFFQLCPAPIIGITGSSGKTTTTTLVGEMLRASSRRTWVGGNIGHPLVGDLDEIAPEDCVVAELSSFQLETLPVSPHIAVLLNLTPDHLDRHATFADYRAAKLSILRHQSGRDAAILNYDDPLTSTLSSETQAQVYGFSLHEALAGAGAFVRDTILTLRLDDRELPLLPASELGLRGAHNVANVLAAALASALEGADRHQIADVARDFTGVAHRLEIVAEGRGLTFVNDSIATSPARSRAGLLAFERPVILLAGGRHKSLPLDDWAELVRQGVRTLVVFGEAAAVLEDAVRSAGAPPPEIRCADNLDDAFAAAVRDADRGSVILLSPACTSFDAFDDYTKRGEAFRELVREYLSEGR